MLYTHNDLYGEFQQIGESDILYEQIQIDNPSGFLVLHNIKEVPDYLYRFQKHCQNVIEILYPQTNQISMLLDGKEYFIQPKDIFVINPGTVHSPGTPEGVTQVDTFIILVDGSWMHCMERDIAFKEVIISSINVRKSLDLVIETYEQGNLMQQKGSLMYFLGSLEKDGFLIETKHITMDRMIRVLNYLNENYSDFNLSPYDIALHENISYSHFSREFKQTMGVSFKSYLTRLRLKHSLRDLRYTSLSITEIALNNGFADVQSLMRACHKLIGMSPGKYRERF